MTLEEATKIIDNEGCFTIKREEEPITDIKLIPWEKVEVNEAISTLGDFRFRVLINMNEESKARFRKLKEEYEMRKKDSTVVTQKPIDFAEEVRKLHEEEECKQTTDEQAKKIKSQKKEIKHLNKLLSSRNKEIWELKDDVKHLCNEIDRLNVIMKGKDELLDKYRINDANKEDMIAALRKELAEKVVNKVDENALKSAESALAYKDEVIEKLTKKYKQLKSDFDELALKYDGARYNLQVKTEKANERDKELNKFAKIIEDKDKTIELIRAGQKEYVDYGVGANNFIKKICHAYVNAHERGQYSEWALLESRKCQYGLSPKAAFKYAKETKTPLDRKEKDLSGFVSDVIEKQKEFNYWLGELNDLINKTSLDEIVSNKEENKNAPSYPTEDNPDEVSLADMVKIVIEAFFDGKSVIIK